MMNQNPLPKLYPVQNIQFLLTQGPDFISQRLREGQLWDHFLITIMELFLKNMERPIFVDIGANLGAISVPIGKLVQAKQGQVHSIEAQRSVFYQLCANFFANQLSQHCFAYHTAVGDEIGTIQVPVLDVNRAKNVGALSLDENIRQQQGWSAFSQYETVPLTMLDAMNLPAASIVKIDVEGMEWEVIRGGLGWLARSGFPPILFEVWGDYMANHIAKRERLLQFLRDELGYDCLIQGDLCIAQHRYNRYLDLSVEQDKLTIKLIDR